MKQRPLFGYTGANGGMPVGQQVIFSVLDATTVSTYFNVEYSATIYIFDNQPLNVATDSIGTFKIFCKY